MTDLLLLVLYLSAGIAAAWEARRKGYDDRLFLVLGVVLGPIALLGMLLLRARPLQVGTVVRPAAPIALDDGRRIRPRTCPWSARSRCSTGCRSAGSRPPTAARTGSPRRP